MTRFSRADRVEEAISELLLRVDPDTAGHDDATTIFPAESTQFAPTQFSNDATVDLGTHIPEKNGLAAMDGNTVKVIPPEDGGSWPVIIPGEHVKVFCDGKLVTKPMAVSNGNKIEVVPEEQLPQTKLSVRVSEDQLTAVLRVEFEPGRRYMVEESEPMAVLRLRAAPAETLACPPISVQEARAILAREKVIYGIDWLLVGQLCESLITQEAVIARGQLVTETMQGWIEYRFSIEERVHISNKEADRIDLFDLGIITSVEPGEVLAVLHPPIAGKPGRSVTGSLLQPTKVQPIFLREGTGVSVSEDGRTAIAQIAGRPSVKPGSGDLQVFPEFLVSGNVDVQTGHITFSGDVRAKGDVLDGLTVKAGGRYSGGSVLGAKIWAEEGIFLRGRVINGEIYSGGETLLYWRLLPKLTTIKDDVQRIVHLYAVINNNGVIRRSSTGSTLKTLIETKTPNLEKRILELDQLVLHQAFFESKPLQQLCRLLKKTLCGRGPTGLVSVEPLEVIASYLDRVAGHITKNPEETQAGVQLEYCQKGIVASAGCVTVSGRACIDSSIYAGDALVVKGSIRGGTAESAVSVTAGELGAPLGAVTRVIVPRDGMIKASVVHPGVRLVFGDRVFNNQETLERVEFRCEQDQIQKTFY